MTITVKPPQKVVALTHENVIAFTGFKFQSALFATFLKVGKLAFETCLNHNIFC